MRLLPGIKQAKLEASHLPPSIAEDTTFTIHLVTWWVSGSILGPETIFSAYPGKWH
jgi:hypothetical protein